MTGRCGYRGHDETDGDSCAIVFSDPSREGGFPDRDQPATAGAYTEFCWVRPDSGYIPKKTYPEGGAVCNPTSRWNRGC